MIVMKFGGTSVGGVEPIQKSIAIVKSKLDKKPVVVVSAMSKVTDLLYKIANAAASKNEAEAIELVEKLRQHHIDTAEQLLENSVENMLPAVSAINEICDELERFVKAIAAIGELSPRSHAIIVSNGEILSSTVISYAMNAQGIKTKWIDARKMIITDENDVLKGEPNVEIIQDLVPKAITEAYESNEAVITQGFISSSIEGKPTILGRGGSDYTASLIGMAIDADVIEIWTDVDGVLTADPRKVPNTQRLERISFEEAAEMAHFGAKVLHPMTIEPAVRKNIPIYVLNSKNPSCSGTAILSNDKIEDGVKSVSFKENILVINIFSTKMINTSGFLGKVFDMFSSHKVSADLISTSEANISVTVDASQDITSLVKELGNFAKVEVDTGKAQVSVVGKNLLNIPGISEKVFVAIEGIKTYMVSQGATNINLSIVVDKAELEKSVLAIHNSLFN